MANLSEVVTAQADRQPWYRYLISVLGIGWALIVVVSTMVQS